MPALIPMHPAAAPARVRSRTASRARTGSCAPHRTARLGAAACATLTLRLQPMGNALRRLPADARWAVALPRASARHPARLPITASGSSPALTRPCPRNTPVLLAAALVIFLTGTPPAAAQLPISFDRYHNYQEMTAFLRQAEARYPDLARLSSIGKSYQGRDLWLLTVTNFRTGAPEAKPAIYINGCLDSSEVVTCEGVLYTIQQLLERYGQDPRITRLVDTRTFYLVPWIMPDHTELYHTSPYRARSLSAEPVDEDDDGKLDEDPEDDVDDDGHIVQMRVKDPAGQWKISDKDPRLMVRRRPGELEGTFYRILTEGKDDDDDGKYNEDTHGGIDPNRNYPGNWAPVHTQRGAGPYPLYVQEVRAEVEFLERQPNIAAYINHHCCGGVILRPSTTHDDSKIPEDDLRLLRLIGAMALDATGYWLATSVYDWRWPAGTPDTKRTQTWRRPDGTLANDPRNAESPGGAPAFAEPPAPTSTSITSPPDLPPALASAASAPDHHLTSARPPAVSPGRDAYPAYGGSIEFTYQLLGLTSFATEQWRAAHDHDLDKNGEISDLERLDWNDKQFKGALFIPWNPFQHPQLGPVEIGGWKKHTSPPPGRYLEDENRRQLAFNLMLAELLPSVKVREVEAEPLGNGLYKVAAKVANEGLIPTATEMQKRVRRAKPVEASLTANRALEFLAGKEKISLGHLPGAPAEPASTEWIVRVKEPGPVEFTVTATAPNAGQDAKSVTAAP